MPTRHRLYVDSEEVMRGYYVYMHKARATGEVFYVGKGSGGRAWEANRRHEKWKEKVASLVGGWDVEIVKQDLSEIEAFELEAELVVRYGGCASTGGKLTNWIPGGEDPVSIQLGIEIDDGGWGTAYRDARTFLEPPRSDKEAIVRKLVKDIEPIINKLKDLDQEAEDVGDESLSDCVINLDVTLRNLSDVSADLLHRRRSWKDFAITLEDTCDDLGSELKEAANYHKMVKSLLIQGYEFISKTLSEIDSGNKKEAEETANRSTRKG